MSYTVVHFEIPADDPDALGEFYNKLFGWKVETTPMDYWLIETAPEGEGIGGGMFKRTEPSQRPMNYIGVDSVDDFVKKVEEFGGKVAVPKQEVPNTGYMAIVLDPDGNPFGLWQDLEQTG